MYYGPLRGHTLRAWIGAAAVAVALLTSFFAAAASAAPLGPRVRTNTALTARVVVSLPTWQDSYDWPAGHGYNGWSSRVAAPDPSGYAFGAPLGAMPGLSLWLPGDLWYTPGAAEWRFDAPGTTRIASADVHLAYRDNLFAHHCLEIGLRVDQTTRDSSRSCNPPDVPATAENYDVGLVDPSAQPSAKQAYMRVEFPPCHNANGNGCPKWIPSLDPAGNAPLARVKSVEMTLVDDDLPTAAASGPLFDAADDYVQGHDPVDVTVSASDAGAGVAGLWAERVGGERLADKAVDCDGTHQTAALGAAVCPPSASATLAVPTADLPEGAVSFQVGATDLAGNTGRSDAWSLFVDRTAPEAPSNIETSYDDESSATFVTWEDGTDPDLPDGDPGSGVDHDEYRWADGAGEWSEWTSEEERGFVVPGLEFGDELTVEVRTVDRVGNVSGVTSDILGVNGPVGDDAPDDTDPGPNDEYDEPNLVASAASSRDDTALAALMRCSSTPSELFFPASQTGNGGVARITRINSYDPGIQPRITRFNPFKPTLPKCRKTRTFKLPNGTLAGGTRDVGTFKDGTHLRHFSAQVQLGWLDTKKHNANGVYMRDSFADPILRIKYVRGWRCGGKTVESGHYRYEVNVYTRPGKLTSPVTDCSNVTTTTPPTLILQGRACITGVHDRNDWVLVGLVLKNVVRWDPVTNAFVAVPDIPIRGFVPADVIPGKDVHGNAIDMSELPEAGCGGAATSTTPTPFSKIQTLQFYYRQDNKKTPTADYGNYNAHDLGGRVEAGYGYQYVLINTTAVGGGGIARAIVPSDRWVDPRDAYSYCDPNGAGPLATKPYTYTYKGKVYQGKKLTRGSVKPHVGWTYGEVMSPGGGTPTHVYGWLPTSALDGMPKPTDPDCRFDDDPNLPNQFHPNAVDDYPFFFNAKP